MRTLAFGFFAGALACIHGCADIGSIAAEGLDDAGDHQRKPTPSSDANRLSRALLVVDSPEKRR